MIQIILFCIFFVLPSFSFRPAIVLPPRNPALLVRFALSLSRARGAAVKSGLRRGGLGLSGEIDPQSFRIRPYHT